MYRLNIAPLIFLAVLLTGASDFTGVVGPTPGPIIIESAVADRFEILALQESRYTRDITGTKKGPGCRSTRAQDVEV